MQEFYFSARNYLRCLAALFLFGLLPQLSSGQQLKISDFVLFGGLGSCPPAWSPNAPPAPGCAVLLASSTTVNGGSVGSYTLVTTIGNSAISGNIFSGGAVFLANKTNVGGRITAANSAGLKSTIFQAGSNSLLGGNIDVNGNIQIASGSGSVTGRVTHPAGTSYSGPVPRGGNVIGSPSLPIMPVAPPITSFPAAGQTNISSSQTIQPGAYNNMTLTGGQTVTLAGPGIYIFNSIKNSGSYNKLVFDFKNKATGLFYLYIYGDVDLNKSNVDTINGGGASRIYAETHGKGSSCSSGPYAWNIANGSAGNGCTNSKWVGTIWAPYAGINIGTGSGQTNITGALWSSTQVNILSGVTLNYAPIALCTTPNAVAGALVQLSCTVASVQLNGSSTTPNAQFSWTASNGGQILSGANTATPTVNAAGTYILTVTNPAGGCTAKDSTTATFIQCILPYYPPPVNGKSSNLIGSELNSLFQNFGQVTDSAKTIFQINQGGVLIEVIARQGQYQNLLSLLQTPAYGITGLVNNGQNSLIISGTYPIANLSKLDSLPSLIDYCRPLFPPLKNNILPPQGDTVMHTNFVRNGYNVQGNGIKVGVMSDSYNSISGNPAQGNILNGILPGPGNPDYPAPVNVLQEYPYGTSSDEGRAMLQVVHEMAPAAKLDFRTGFISPGDFAQGIIQLQQDSCNIIVDDVTYITEPFFQDGVVSQAINYVAGKGVSYFTAAGNYGQASYSGTFNPAPAPNGITGSAHNFGGSIYQNISLTPGTYTIVLQWQDSIYSIGQTTTGTMNDLDIYLTDTAGRTLFGFNRNNLGGDPIEVLPFTVTANTNTNLMIVRAAGSSNLAFKYVVFRGNLTINNFKSGSSTIVGQANAAGAMAVGAVRFKNTPAYGLNAFTPESFSSFGGTVVNGVVRNKPDFLAPDGVSTTVDFGSINISGSPFPSFFGTSCAAPHAAGLAALLLEGKKKYSGQTLTPTQVRSLLQNSALQPAGTPAGFNFLTGYGLLQADSAFKTFASPTAVITKLVLADTTIKPGTQPTTVTVQGNFLSSNSVVTMRGTPLPTTVINSTQAIATIPTFTGNPAIQVFT